MIKILAAVLLLATAAIPAANATYIPLPVPLQTTPNSGAAVPCQGGTGSVISTITTTATTVCAAATSRSFASVIPNSGTAGTIVAYGTFDGTTPSSSHYNFVLYGTGVGWDTSGYAAVPTGAIQLVAASGNVTITAVAIQSPVP